MDLWAWMVSEVEGQQEVKQDDFNGLGMVVGFVFGATILIRIITKIMEVLP